MLNSVTNSDNIPIQSSSLSITVWISMEQGVMSRFAIAKTIFCSGKSWKLLHIPLINPNLQTAVHKCMWFVLHQLSTLTNKKGIGRNRRGKGGKEWDEDVLLAEQRWNIENVLLWITLYFTQSLSKEWSSAQRRIAIFFCEYFLFKCWHFFSFLCNFFCVEAATTQVFNHLLFPVWWFI